MTTISDLHAASDQAAVRDLVAEIDQSMGELRCAGSQQLLRAGVSMSHLHVMWLLRRHGDLTMGHLADMLDVSLSNATGLIDRMAERGLVDRIRVPDDRRVVMVTLSAHGRQMLEFADVLRSDLLEAILRRLDARQLDRVAGALADVREAIRAARAAGDLPTDDHSMARTHWGANVPEGKPVPNPA